MFRKTKSVLILVSSCSLFYAQPQLSFSPFQGKVYEIPYKKIKSGYGPHIYEYEEIGEINWTEINVPESQTSEPFPDVTRRTRFGMVLHSEMTVEYDACYEFSLNSDDGSLLWVDKKLVVNNKGDHKMTMVRDTAQIKKGTYPVKIWYHQAYPDRYGFIFKFKYSGPPDSCVKNLEPEKKAEVITLNSSVLFDYDSWVATDKTIEEINNLIEKIQLAQPKQISVFGYTDNRGSPEYNLKLSQKRSDIIVELLQKKLKPGIIYLSKGLGENFPLATNDTTEGRQLNRRVEIKIE